MRKTATFTPPRPASYSHPHPSPSLPPHVTMRQTSSFSNTALPPHVTMRQTTSSSKSNRQSFPTRTSIDTKRPKPPSTFLFFKTCLTLISTVLYMTDIYSDLVLGVQYLMNGDFTRGILTLVFTVVPYLVQLYFCSSRAWQEKEGVVRCLHIAMTLCGLGPVAANIDSLVMFYQGKEVAANAEKSESLKMRAINVVMQDVPQLVLQLFIVGQRNHFTVLIVVSTLTSFLAASKGLFNAGVEVMVMMRVKRERAKLSVGQPATVSLEKELVLNLAMQPMFALMILCIIPTVCFYASMDDHSHPAYLLLLIYFAFHVIVTSFFLVGTFKRRFEFSGGRSGRVISWVLQVVFFFVCNLLVGRWFVSVAPLLPGEQGHPTPIAGIPSFVWPKPIPLLQSWVFKFPNSTNDHPDWTTCGFPIENRTIQSNSTNNGTDTGAAEHFADSTATTHHSFQWQLDHFCITDHSDAIFVFIVSCTFLLVTCHFVLIFVYPKVHWYVWGQARKRKSKRNRNNSNNSVKKDSGNRLSLLKKVSSGEEENGNSTPMIKRDIPLF